jgi:Co/Zn/Cd efflux system component
MTLRKAVFIAGIANLLYFAVEFTVALKIGSVSLFADSVDFLEDACVNALVFAGLNWTAQNRARLGYALGCSILLPALATAWTAVAKFNAPLAPAFGPLAITGLGALLVNLCCALLLAKFRNQQGSLTRAAFLSARNDVIANVAILCAALATFYTNSFWADLLVGTGIGFMNLDAARQVFGLAHAESKA